MTMTTRIGNLLSTSSALPVSTSSAGIRVPASDSFAAAYQTAVDAVANGASVRRQSAGSTGGASDGTAAEQAAAKVAAAHEKALQDLNDFASRKGVLKQMREAVLKSMHLTEADLAAKPPAERFALEQEIARQIQARLTGKEAGEQSQLAISGLNQLMMGMASSSAAGRIDKA